MTEQRNAVRWLKERRAQAAAAILLALLFGVLYFSLDGTSKTVEFVRDLAPNVVVGCAAYLLVNYLLFRDELDDSATFLERIAERVRQVSGLRHGVIATPDTVFDVDWVAYLSRTHEVKGWARYLDQWADRYNAELVALLRRGGSILLFLPDPDDVESFAVMARDTWAIKRYPEQLAVTRLQDRVQNTIDVLDRIQARAYQDHARDPRSRRLAGEVEIRRIRRPIVYWALMLDDRLAVSASYEHAPTSDRRMPVTVTGLHAAPNLHRFLTHELAEFEVAAPHAPPYAVAPAGATNVVQRRGASPPQAAPKPSAKHDEPALDKPTPETAVPPPRGGGPGTAAADNEFEQRS